MLIVCQIGFRKNHSTATLYTNLLKQTVDCHTKRGIQAMYLYVLLTLKRHSTVTVYSKLSNKLLDDGIPVEIVTLLFHWYAHQYANVYAGCTLSDSFSIEKCTWQGGILLLYLITTHIRELLSFVVDTRIGCNVGDTI
jgi:hypothetical protein